MTGRLTLTRALESSGMPSEAAERIATEIGGVINDNFAAKAVVVAVRADLAAVKADLERQIDRLAVRLGAVAAAVASLLFGALHLWPPH